MIVLCSCFISFRRVSAHHGNNYFTHFKFLSYLQNILLYFLITGKMNNEIINGSVVQYIGVASVSHH